jgi:hypothetical protein
LHVDHSRKAIERIPELHDAAALLWRTLALAEGALAGTRIRVDTTQAAIQRAERFVRDRIMDRLTLKDLARAAALSEFHFARIFHRRTGHPGFFWFADWVSCHLFYHRSAFGLPFRRLDYLFATLVLDFERLVDLAVLAVLGQYLASSAALVRLGRRRSEKLLGLSSIAISVGFGVQCTLDQFRALGWLMPIGVLVVIPTRAIWRSPAYSATEIS